jgi:hypothetical protein
MSDNKIMPYKPGTAPKTYHDRKTVSQATRNEEVRQANIQSAEYLMKTYPVYIPEIAQGEDMDIDKKIEQTGKLTNTARKATIYRNEPRIKPYKIIKNLLLTYRIKKGIRVAKRAKIKRNAFEKYSSSISDSNFLLNQKLKAKDYLQDERKEFLYNYLLDRTNHTPFYECIITESVIEDLIRGKPVPEALSRPRGLKAAGFIIAYFNHNLDDIQQDWELHLEKIEQLRDPQTTSSKPPKSKNNLDMLTDLANQTEVVRIMFEGYKFDH